MNTLGIFRCLLRSRVLAWSWLIVNRCQTNKLIRVLLVSLILRAAKSVLGSCFLDMNKIVQKAWTCKFFVCLLSLSRTTNRIGLWTVSLWLHSPTCSICRRLRFWHPVAQWTGSNYLASWWISIIEKPIKKRPFPSCSCFNDRVFQRYALLAPSLVTKIERIKPPCDFGW